MLPNRDALRVFLTAPAASLAVGLLLAVCLFAVPVERSSAVKSAAAALLKPCQEWMLVLRQRGRHIADRTKSHFDTADKLSESQLRLQQLEEENCRLSAELETFRSQPPGTPENTSARGSDPLFETRAVRARVLGHQARAYLADHHLLDVGDSSGVAPSAMVVDLPPGLIDQGTNRSIEADQIVLSRGRVWGKIVEVGPHTSSVKTATEPGYRDLVRLADSKSRPDDRGAGPQGILEGCGEPLARIRLVEVTEPVAIGDAVFSAADKGLLPNPMLYGHVVRLERPVGAAHWEIWMQPAVGPDEPSEVVVLKTELNPARVARNEKAVGLGIRD